MSAAVFAVIFGWSVGPVLHLDEPHNAAAALPSEFVPFYRPLTDASTAEQIAKTHCMIGIRVWLLALVMTALPVPAPAKDAAISVPRWSRPLAAEPSHRTSAILMPLPGGGVIARNGAGVIAVDARGATRWSMPKISSAIVDGSMVVFRRPNVVFAVRSNDAGVLWKRACPDPQYLVVTGDRIVTMCAGVSTVLRARDGSVVARHAVSVSPSPPMLSGARRLTDRYVLVTNFFDGAWMGHSFNVVDARTGTFLWSETDADFFNITPTTVDVSPYPSMLPWAAAGIVVRRRLVDGAKLRSQEYATPQSSDEGVRGRVTLSRAATYVQNFNTGLFRFGLGDTRAPQTVLAGGHASAITLGSGAFVFNDVAMTSPGGPLYIDRPMNRGGFETRTIGRFSGQVSVQNTDAWPPETDVAVHVGGRLAIPDNGLIRFYDEFGSVELTVKSPCRVPLLAATSTMVFMRCPEYGSPGTLAGFALR